MLLKALNNVFLIRIIVHVLNFLASRIYWIEVHQIYIKSSVHVIMAALNASIDIPRHDPN